MPTPSAAARLALAVLPLFLAGCSSLAGSGSADTGEASYYGSRGRMIDVSRKAAEGLGMIRSGVAPVQIESLD